MNSKLTNILLVVILTILLVQTCKEKNQEVVEQHFRDTSFVLLSGDTTLNKTVIKPTEIIPYVYTSKDTQYIPDTNYNVLKTQYEHLRDSLLTTKVYIDTYKIATLGDAKIKTTVFKNNVIEQKFNYNIKYPVIKDCVIVASSKKSEFYLGTGILGNETQPVKGIELNLSLKTKSDKIFEIKTQYINKEFVHGIGIKTKL